MDTIDGRARGGAHPAAADPDDLGGHGHGRRADRASGSARASISRRPLGYAIVGGVLFSTLLTLYVVPVGVRHLRRAAGPDARARARRARHGARPGGGGVIVGAAPRAAGSPPAPAPCRRPTPSRRSRWPRRSAARPGSTPTTSGRWARSTTPSGGAGPRSLAFIRARRSRSASTRPSTRPSSSTRPTGRTRPSTLGGGLARARTTRCSASASSPSSAAPRRSSRAPRPASWSSGSGPRWRPSPSYYDVLVNQELARVAEERARRARGGSGRRPGPGGLGRRGPDRLAPAGAGADPRPGGPAACERNALRTAQLELGRRVGEARAGGRGAAGHHAGAGSPDRAARGDPGGARRRGRSTGRARANERAANGGAQVGSAATTSRPSASARCTSATTPRSSPARPTLPRSPSVVSFPIWNNGRREIEVSRARVNRDVARAIREDLERRRAPRRDAGVRRLREQPRGGAGSPASGWSWRGRTTGCRRCATAPGATHHPRPAGRPGQPRRGRGGPGAGALRRPGWRWRGWRRFWAADSSRTRTPRETDIQAAPCSLGLAACGKADGAPEGAGAGGGGRRRAARRCRSKSSAPRPIPWWTPSWRPARSRRCKSIELRPDIEGRIAEILVREGADGVPGHAAVQGGRRRAQGRGGAGRGGARSGAAVARAHPRAPVRRRPPASRSWSGPRRLRASTEAQLQLLKVRLDRTTVRAPFAGVVGRRLVSLGDYVTTDTPA